MKSGQGQTCSITIQVHYNEVALRDYTAMAYVHLHLNFKEMSMYLQSRRSHEMRNYLYHLVEKRNCKILILSFAREINRH